VDPIGLLRGAKSRAAAVAFIEYMLSVDGQKMWNLRPGTPGGPEHFALRRLPIRRDIYSLPDWKELCSDPTDRPYEEKDQLIYRDAWTGGIFREMAFAIRIMTMDTHDELTRAWRAIIDAGMPEDALAALQDVSAIEYEQANGSIKAALSSKNKADEIRTANRLGSFFREHYAKAEALARSHGSVALRQ
jgi:ABC-type glycerol-3-phosphate transport system substrate-binding protein